MTLTIVSSKAFTRMDPNSSALALLEVTKDLFGVDLRLEDLAGEVVENLPRIGEDHFLAKPIEEFDSVGGVELLDLLGDGRLGDVESLRRGAQTAALHRVIESLELIEVQSYNFRLSKI